MQRVNIEMPLSVYDGLLSKCDKSSREYATLVNGIIVHKDNPGDITEILCDLIDAERLLISATKVYPDAVEYITRAILAASRSS
jgi:hypothetical protein